MKKTRRTFIRDAALAGAVLATAPTIIAQSRALKYRTALIGTGWWGGNILGEGRASGECSPGRRPQGAGGNTPAYFPAQRVGTGFHSIWKTWESRYGPFFCALWWGSGDTRAKR